MNQRIGALGCLWLLVTACATTETHHVITGRPAAAHQNGVTVFMSGSQTPPYEEVAILQAVGKGGHADLEHVIDGLREEAATLGCNAIVNVKVDQGEGQASGTALCVLIPPRYAPPVAPAPPAPSPAAVAEQPPPTPGVASPPEEPAQEPEAPPADPPSDESP